MDVMSPTIDTPRFDRDSTKLDALPITLIGHPWAPIGMGEQLRSHLQACTALRLHHQVFDVYRIAQRTDPVHARCIAAIERDDVPPGIRIFHINGDEVESVIAAMEARGNKFDSGYNIIVPAWELPTYPKAWALHLQKFDEVWALSRFIADSLATAGIRSQLIGQSVELEPGPCLPRRFFGIRESAFVLLNFFDLQSYSTRKNPDAVLALFDRIRAENPLRDIQLVLKVKNGEKSGEDWAATRADDAQIKVIATPLDSFGIKSLISTCDCFVSLHRSEGFGRGLGEAMALGRLAMGTGWSGNVDFMSADNSLFVDHDMIKLKRDDYPFGRASPGPIPASTMPPPC